MKKYMVMVPLVGISCVEVEAEGEEQAKKEAIDIACDFKRENVDLNELYGVDKVVEGNACYHPLFEIDLEEII